MIRLHKLKKGNQITFRISFFSLAALYSASFHCFILYRITRPSSIIFLEEQTPFLSFRHLSTLVPEKSSSELNTSTLTLPEHHSETEKEPTGQKQLCVHVFIDKRNKYVKQLLKNITDAEYKVIWRNCLLIMIFILVVFETSPGLC